MKQVDEKVETVLLNVREAAKRLGVHENTLRRWEKAGLIRAVKFPTGVRRFRPEDVNQLHDEMHGVADEASPVEHG